MSGNIIIVSDNVTPPPTNTIVVASVVTEDENCCTTGGDSSFNGDHNNLTAIQGGDPNDRYHINKDEYDAVTGSELPSADNPFITQSVLAVNSGKLKETLTVNLGEGVVFGGVTTGDTFTEDDSVEQVLRALLIKSIPHIYVQPTISLSWNINNTIEIGTIANVVLSSIINRNDAGPLTTYQLYLNNATLSNNNPHTDTGRTITSTVTYYATQAYQAGPVIDDNLGNPTPGHILAGTITSNSLVCTPLRRLFFNTSNTIPTNSAEIRALGNKGVFSPVYANINNFTIPIEAGDKSVIFAVPTDKTLVSVILDVGLISDETASFVSNLTIIPVQGAANYTAIDYDLYYYTPIGVFTSPCTYTVTLE